MRQVGPALRRRRPWADVPSTSGSPAAQEAIPVYSPDYRVLVELNKQVCNALVVFARLEAIGAAGHGRDTMEGQRLSALQGMNDYALLMHAHRTLKWLGIAKGRHLVDRILGPT